MKVFDMSYTFPLEEMDTAEKLRLMEALWADLSKEPNDIPVPDWHSTVLAEREQQVKNGEATFHDWNKVKERIRRKTLED